MFQVQCVPDSLIYSVVGTALNRSVCPRQSDLFRAVPTTIVIWARRKKQLIYPGAAGTEGTGRDR